MPTETLVDPSVNVAALVQAARTDTVYRDLYMDRARSLLAPMLSEADYQRLERERETSQELPLRIQRAVEQGQWPAVRDFTDRMQAIRQELADKRRVIELAHDVFGSEVTLDPFSPGLQLFTGLSRTAQAALRKEAVERLTSLARGDAAERTFYDERRRALETLALTGSDDVAPGGAATVDTREAAMMALKSGDIGRLKAMAEAMMAGPAPQTPAAGAREAPRGASASAPTADLAFTFSADTLAAARGFGLAPRHLAAKPDVAELRSYAWHPLFSEGAQRIGVKNIPLPEGIDAGFRERLEMFMIHPMVNSGGARHLPQLVDEDVLIEDFPDPADGATPPAGPLLEALGVQARQGISRDTIERQLGRTGRWLIEHELGLDPRRFRVVCIPPDVHLRLGAHEHWGRQAMWTHFDGYLVMPNGRLRALAGGDVRFGGLYNLVGVGRDYDSDKLLVRFAVVRRERMTAW
jgi:hypothetical protein